MKRERREQVLYRHVKFEMRWQAKTTGVVWGRDAIREEQLMRKEERTLSKKRKEKK